MRRRSSRTVTRPARKIKETHSGRTFEVSATIEDDRERVFALSQDYARRLLWDPFLKEARLIDGATVAALGAKAWCVSKGGLGMETEYVSFEPPSVAAVRMTRGPFFIKAFAASWRFFELNDGKTQVSFKYFVDLHRPFGFLMPLILRIFARETQGRIDGLRVTVAGGEALTRS
jgi:Polyketide cyclase / dehydrase and lipid transport